MEVSDGKNIKSEVAMAFSVLIIEDEEILSSILKEFLEELEVEADIAENGEEAISKLKLRTYDAAIVDQGLPDLSGDDIILNAYAIRPDVKYFIYTGDRTYKPSEELLSIGVDNSRVIYKPVLDMMTIYNKILKIE